LEQALAGGALRWSGVSLLASTIVGLGGVAPQSLDEGYELRCERREEMSSGVIGMIDEGHADLKHEVCSVA
jgi:hypothetical protein